MGIERKKIIAVDDNIENLTALKNTLKSAYDVFPCPSAAKMFDMLNHIKPNIILLDVEMPEMSGHEAIQKLKSSEAHSAIPVVFLTSMNDEESKQKGLSLGAVDYIYKPFDSASLLKQIETHIA